MMRERARASSVPLTCHREIIPRLPSSRFLRKTLDPHVQNLSALSYAPNTIRWQKLSINSPCPMFPNAVIRFSYFDPREYARCLAFDSIRSKLGIGAAGWRLAAGPIVSILFCAILQLADVFRPPSLLPPRRPIAIP